MENDTTIQPAYDESGGNEQQPGGSSWLQNGTRIELAAAEDYLPDWTDLLLAVCFSTLIVVTIVGNTLVIAAVITTRRLRSVTNCFVSSLAAADLLVGLAVMPPAVLLQLNGGTWELGEVLCDSWVSLDVLLCTASILSLCAISIDRYLAVTQPLIYSRRRRSKRLAGLMIVVVWILAGAITSPPLLGCFPRVRGNNNMNNSSSNASNAETITTTKKCSYNMDSSYVIFSAMGSFFLPMLVMLYVYGRISCVIAKRHRHLETADAVSAGDCHGNNKPYWSSKQQQQQQQHRHHLPAHQASSPTGQPSRLRRESVSSRAHGSSAQQQQQQQRRSTRSLLDCFQTTGAGAERGPKGPSTTTSEPRSLLAARLSAASCSEGTTSEAAAAAAATATTTGRVATTTATTTISTTGTGTCTLAVPTSTGATTRSAEHPGAAHSPSRKMTRTGTVRQQHSSCINRVTRETKTAGTLAVVVGGFVACWLPFFVLYLATPFIPVEPPDPLMPALTWLGWINSAINPFIYAFYSADFRMAFWRLTCRRCLRLGRFELSNPAAERALHGGGGGGGASQAGGPNWRRQTSRT